MRIRQSIKKNMKALFLALLLISQPPKLQISGGIGISMYGYYNDGSHSDNGVTFRGFVDYWVRDFLAFGIDSGYQYFGEEGWKISRNIFCLPYVKIGTINTGKNKLFLLIGYGFDVVGMGYISSGSNGDIYDIDDFPHSAFNFGAGYMRNFGDFHTGVVFNDIYVRNQDVCGDGCMENIHLPTLSIFFGFGI